MAGAVFFDLDRTLLRGASTPVIRNSLAKVGLVSEKGLPGESIFLRVYNVFGESMAHMAVARLAAFASKGWSVELANKAGEIASHDLIELIAPFAPALIAEHKSELRPLVLATTTPWHLVAPFARLAGFDDVIATRYDVRDGYFTGRLDGRFVWSGWKLAQVKQWARDNSISLKDSFAYSDSIYDTPLLSAVGYPYCVNPDNRLRALAIARRWPTLFLDVPPGVPKFVGIEPFEVARRLIRPSMIPFARFEVTGAERARASGPVIIACNHRSYFDVAAVGIVASKIGRPIRFLAKKEMIDAPIIGPMARSMGAIRVDRGADSDKPLNEAIRGLRSGEAIGIFPQGTIPRGEKFFDPVLYGKTGAVRLARETGAKIVPVGIWGTEKVWPRSARIPKVSNVINPPHVFIKVGQPIDVDTLDNDVVLATQQLMEAIVKLLPEAARKRAKPTAEQISIAMPPGSTIS